MARGVSKFNATCPYCTKNIVQGEHEIIWSPAIKNSGVHKHCYEKIKEEGKTLSQFMEDREKMPIPNPKHPEGSGSELKMGEPKPWDDNDPMSKMAKELLPYLQGRANQVDSKELEKFLKRNLNSAVKKHGVKKLEVKIETPKETKQFSLENAHHRMDKLLYLLQLRHHVYLHGMPGGGKSHGAWQAADSLGLEYSYIALNPQTPESRLLGFIDATGKYRGTEFRKRYETGGVFCIDELDNSAPALATTLNGCLEQNWAAFPDGMVKRHEDFVCVGTGNTNGRGANPFFPERRPFDAAFAERFTFIDWPYDEALETKLTLAINQDAEMWLEWVRKVREFCFENVVRLVVSPRASFRGAQYLNHELLKSEEIADAVIFKGVDVDTKQRILENCGKPPKVMQKSLPGTQVDTN